MWKFSECQNYVLWTGAGCVKASRDGHYRICPYIFMTGDLPVQGIALAEFSWSACEHPAVRAVVSGPSPRSVSGPGIGSIQPSLQGMQVFPRGPIVLSGGSYWRI